MMLLSWNIELGLEKLSAVRTSARVIVYPAGTQVLSKLNVKIDTLNDLLFYRLAFQ